MLRTYGHDEAMKLAVGGAYEEMGVKERDCLILAGLNARDYLVDVGCGSGRLAFALRDLVSLRYLGTDVIPEFVKYSIEKCGRPDWRFVLVEDLSIPERDNQADMVAFFSLFPHLSRRECFIYLKEAARVVLPGGRIVVSFLDSSLRWITDWLRDIGSTKSCTGCWEIV
jgi:ubiquinone/menaquinone biosynthesis C-methylase UbiE